MIGGIQAELDSFSNYIQHNVAVGAEYDSIRRVVDSYQPSSERFRGLGPFPEAFFKRLKRAVSGAWKVASKVAGSAVNVAGRVLKAVALPKIFLDRITGLIKFIGNNLKRFLKWGFNLAIQRGVPPIARPFFIRAAKNYRISRISDAFIGS